MSAIILVRILKSNIFRYLIILRHVLFILFNNSSLFIYYVVGIWTGLLVQGCILTEPFIRSTWALIVALICFNLPCWLKSCKWD